MIAYEKTNAIIIRVFEEHGSHQKTSHSTDLYPNRATEHKCKLMLAKSPESAHKKMELIAPVFF